MAGIADIDGELTFEWVPPGDLHDYWDLILPGLEKVKKHGDRWRTEDAYASIRAGQSNLHIGYLDRQYAGFFILTPQQSYDGPVLHIWALYSEIPGLLGEEGMGQLKEWAKSMKAKRITYQSPRKGWEKVGQELGFTPITTIYEIEVKP